MRLSQPLAVPTTVQAAVRSHEGFPTREKNVQVVLPSPLPFSTCGCEGGRYLFPPPPGPVTRAAGYTQHACRIAPLESGFFCGASHVN